MPKKQGGGPNPAPKEAKPPRPKQAEVGTGTVASVCSPMGEKEYAKDRTCFTKPALERLVNAWNVAHPTQKIGTSACRSKKGMWKALNQRMILECKGAGREWCWVDKLKVAHSSPIIAKSLRPSKPREWYKNPTTWLSNFDIEAVMRQYEEVHENHYHFLGVFPMDFAKKDMFGQCLFQEICALDLAKMSKKGIRHLGMITNLDYHEEDGSHWTSLFVCIDPTMPCFGAFYYDSVAPAKPPPEIAQFMQMLRAQATAHAQSKGSNAPFRLEYNRVRHQKGNTECGLFSIAFQLRWLDEVTKHSHDPSVERVMQVKLKDDDVFQLRDQLFRPNTKLVVGA